MDTKETENQVRSQATYRRSRWAQAQDITNNLTNFARRIYERRGIGGSPDYTKYKRVAYQLQASTHVVLAPVTMTLTDVPTRIDPDVSYQMNIELYEDSEKYAKYRMPFSFRFGREFNGILHRVLLVEPTTLHTGVNQYQRWEIAETMFVFFGILEASGFSSIAVVDDQLFAWTYQDSQSQG